MKKNNNYFVRFVPLLRQQGYYLPELPLNLPLSLRSLLPVTYKPTYITGILEKIQLKLEHLNKSERKVADIILASPEQAIHSSIAASAVEANVSKPTVNRFCRSMDTRSFSDFKLHLAQGPANGTPYVNRNVDGDDSIESYTGKTFESAMASLDHVRQSLGSAAVNQTVNLLTQAKKVAFFSLGPSTAVARDAMNKFFCSNVPVTYSSGVVLQRMSCVNCSNGDAIVLISYAGRTKSLVELAQLARESNAMVIVLTSPDTPPTREATLAVTLDVSEDTDIYMPMVSRLAQLTVTNVLATGFTLRRGTEFRDNLKRVKEALKESRFDKELLIKSDNRQKQ